MRVDLQALAGLHELARAGAAGATAGLRGPTVTGTAREGRLYRLRTPRWRGTDADHT